MTLAEPSDVKPMWCVVISKPMNEELAEKSIREAGYRAYLPRYRKMLTRRIDEATGRRIACRKGGEIVMRPLFPRYLFAEWWPDMGWARIKAARGVQDLIWAGEDPYSMPDYLIEELREREKSGEFDGTKQTDKPRTDLKIGGLVRIPGHEMIGELLAVDAAGQLVVDENGRARVLMEFLGRQVKPWVEAKTLQIVAA